ncbi:MAG TPA: endonuclease domain-containing protein [Pseudolabrys sp.]|nr:endonuclease domain-containing protein [Pseudolabrys sp.]
MGRAQAKQLRKRMTDAVLRLWYRLRAHRFHKVKFKRQFPIGPYIVDFVSFQHSLIVEVDGGQHSENRADHIRDQWLRSQGFRILRFWNNDVLKRTELVLGEVSRMLACADLSTPLPARSARHPLPQRERGPDSRH